MNKTRLSLFYLAGYLLPTGLLLMAAPDLVFRLTFSTGSYGTVIPRLAGGLAFALFVLVAQIIRYRVEVLYATTVGVRVFLLALLGALYSSTSDPFFIIVAGVVGLGVALTSAFYLSERGGRSAGVSAAAPPRLPG